jgi:hypothetical protein
MKNRIQEACFSLFVLFLLSIVFSTAVFMCMLFMPFVSIAIFVLAVREIIIWKRNKKLSLEKRKTTKEVTRSQSSESIIRYMHLNISEHVA